MVQLAIVAVNILLVILFVEANTDFCGSVFETRDDYALVGHIMSTAVVVDEFECQLKCLENESCKSINVHTDIHICELNNITRQMKPGDFKWKKGSTYYGTVEVSCIDASHGRNEKTRSGQCHPGYKGKRCETAIKGLNSHQPARSCKDIRDSRDSRGDGEYWIVPESRGNPLKVFCDMTTDGGKLWW